METLFARAGTCSSLPWQISALRRANARSPSMLWTRSVAVHAAAKAFPGKSAFMSVADLAVQSWALRRVILEDRSSHPEAGR